FALTYSTILATVPILAIVFAIGKGLGYGSIIEGKIKENLSVNTQFADAILSFINSYLNHTQSGIFIGFGLLLLLYTVIQLTANIEVALNSIWRVKNQRSIYRQITDYISVFLLLPIVIKVISSLSIFLATIDEDYPNFMVLSTTAKGIITLSPYALSGLLFTLLYTYMPNTDVRSRHAVFPGFIAGTAFQFLQYFYIHSQIWVSSYNAIYGSFAALPMFMLWVNFSWIICLFGAQLSYANQNLKSYYYIKDIHKISRSYHDVLLILIMSKVCKRFEKGMESYTLQGLSVETRLPVGVISLLTDELKQMHLLAFEGTNPDDVLRFTPAEDINSLSISLLLERMDNYGDKFTPAAIHRNNTEWETIRNLRARYIRKSDTTLLKDL
ncbi:MAG: YihY/virulence factor BrkB family protein, partial [Paraprevotella sp.]|nr:YihY/virulence factor BrkB family protein [Paraprevotella sp.]